jgi:O-antigen ligase
MLVIFGAVATFIVSSLKLSATAVVLSLAAVLLLLLITVLTPAIGQVTNVLKSITWWQVLWFFVFLSGLVFRERDVQATEAEPLDTWALFRISLMALVAIVLLVRLSLRRTPWLQQLVRGTVAALSAYCVVCLISSLWSVYPEWTVYKSLEFFVDVAVLAAIVTTATSAEIYKKLFDWTWTLTGLLLGSVWLGLVLWPQDAMVVNLTGSTRPMLSGVIPDVNPNSVGELGAILGVVAFCRLLLRKNSRNSQTSSWMGYGLLFLMSIATMILAQGRSAILGFVVGIFLVLLCSGRILLGFSLASVGVLALSFASIWQTFAGYMSRGETESKLYSLSDRVEWWSLAWPRIVDRPFAGYGAFAGGRFLVMAENKIDAGIHSDWVEILVGTGLIGFLLAVVVWASTWRQFLKSLRDKSLGSLESHLLIEAVAVLGIISIRSIFTTDLFWHPPIVFFACIAYAEFLRMRHNRAPRRTSPSPKAA